MKQIILGSVLAIAAATSISAHAAVSSICSGNAVAADGQSVTAATDGTTFVRVGFVPKCSSNVILYGDDNSPTVYRVGSASIKGKKTFNGSTVGGSVAVSGDCTASGCVTGDVTTAVNAAPTS